MVKLFLLPECQRFPEFPHHEQEKARIKVSLHITNMPHINNMLIRKMKNKHNNEMVNEYCEGVVTNCLSSSSLVLLWIS